MPEFFNVAKRRLFMGLPYMTSVKFRIFYPPVTVTNQLILFPLSAFWGPPPPSNADVIYGGPLRQNLAPPKSPSYCGVKKADPLPAHSMTVRRDRISILHEEKRRENWTLRGRRRIVITTSAVDAGYKNTV